MVDLLYEQLENPVETINRFEENMAALRELGLPLEGQALADQIRSLSELEPSLYSRFLNLFPRGSFPK